MFRITRHSSSKSFIQCYAKIANQNRLKHFIIQQTQKYIIRRYNKNIIKYLKFLHVSDHQGSIITELYAVLA